MHMARMKVFIAIENTTMIKFLMTQVLALALQIVEEQQKGLERKKLKSQSGVVQLAVKPVIRF